MFILNLTNKIKQILLLYLASQNTKRGLLTSKLCLSSLRQDHSKNRKRNHRSSLWKFSRSFKEHYERLDYSIALVELI